MGFIDAVRAWLFGADDDAAEPGGETDASDGAGGTEDGDDRDDEPDGLDPAGAKETRTAAATDDAVDALRDVRTSQESDDAGRSTVPDEGNGNLPDETDGNPPDEGDGNPPDDDPPKSADDRGTNR
jgi:hypothetical protein